MSEGHDTSATFARQAAADLSAALGEISRIEGEPRSGAWLHSALIRSAIRRTEVGTCSRGGRRHGRDQRSQPSEELWKGMTDDNRAENSSTGLASATSASAAGKRRMTRRASAMTSHGGRQCSLGPLHDLHQIFQPMLTFEQLDDLGVLICRVLGQHRHVAFEFL
jgi:hypothetical protein